VDALELLLDLGFDANASRTTPRWARGETALHVVAGRGRSECARVLIERGARLNAKDSRGRTPLAVALLCLEQQSEWTPNDYTLGIARQLIDAGASLDEVQMTLAGAVCLGRTDDVQRIAVNATARDRQVALAAAAYNGLADTIPMLIGLGADPNAPNEGLHPHAMALHNAVCSGSLDTVKRLVEAGARLDVKDAAYQATPGDWADHFMRENRGPAKQDEAIAAYLK
jgi:ankyrin repeat protein